MLKCEVVDGSGPVAQLVERYIRIVEVGSSNLPRSTKIRGAMA